MRGLCITGSMFSNLRTYKTVQQKSKSSKTQKMYYFKKNKNFFAVEFQFPLNINEHNINAADKFICIGFILHCTVRVHICI